MDSVCISCAIIISELLIIYSSLWYRCCRFLLLFFCLGATNGQTGCVALNSKPSYKYHADVFMAPNLLQFIRFVHIFLFLFFIWPEAAQSKLFVSLVWSCDAVLFKCTNWKWIFNISDKSDQRFEYKRVANLIEIIRKMIICGFFWHVIFHLYELIVRCVGNRLFSYLRTFPFSPLHYCTIVASTNIHSK